MSDKAVLLFVDDDERIVRLLKVMFRAQYEVHTALGAEEACAVLARTPVDVIVSDQRMPETTGIQLLAKVRERWPSTVRILLTGYSDLVAMIGAVNDGEVYRFLNKPWDQTELRDVIADAVQVAKRNAAAPPSPLEGAETAPQLGIASQLLAIEGVESDRQEVVEMFTYDYRVQAAGSIKEAITILQQEQIGVIVTNTEVNGVDMTALLSEIVRDNPSIAVVVMTAVPKSDVIIKLINQGRIYRFAIKPLSPNLFRLAVNAAMREHHRRLADPNILTHLKERDEAREAGNGEIYNSFITSLKRFTQVS